MKKYTIQYNVGRAKYLVSFHDGVSKHSDDSEFFDIRIFKNKPSLTAFINQLTTQGYELSPLY